MDIFFPHDEIRNIQDDLINDIINAIKNNKNILVHAPTGIGKTAAVLSTTVAYAIKNNRTIFFVTSRNTQHKIAIETLNKIREKFKIKINAADFIGKRWMCLIPNITELGTAEFYDFCHENTEKGLCEFYNNLKDHNKMSIRAKNVLERLNERVFSVNEVIDLCKANNLCPHEITMLHAQDSNIIIADYYHVLSTSIRESILKRSKKEIKNAIIIFDESHNLPSRCRELLSSQLSTYVLEKSIKELKSFGYSDLAENVNMLNNILLELNKKIKITENETLISKEEFYNAVNNAAGYKELVNLLTPASEVILEDKKRSFTKSIVHFLEKWPGPNESFTRILKRGFTKKGKINLILNYRCLDPSIVLKPISDEARVIAMSGTLSPTKIYKDLFGFDADLKEYKDPFPKKNRLNLIIPGVTTKFTSRDNDMYKKIAEISAGIVNAIKGNSIIFFPSYHLIDDVSRFFNPLCERTTFFERPKLSKTDKEDIIENFKKYKDKGAVLLACASGSFGEGIDLPGDYLKAVLIVGLPLAKPDLEMKETIKYYDEKFGNGWDYGYTFPALTKCFQNAGRCIRSETDRGAIVFLDSRYCLSMYKKFFPSDWETTTTKDPIKLINEFFDKN